MSIRRRLAQMCAGRRRAEWRFDGALSEKPSHCITSLGKKLAGSSLPRFSAD